MSINNGKLAKCGNESCKVAQTLNSSNDGIAQNGMHIGSEGDPSGVLAAVCHRKRGAKLRCSLALRRAVAKKWCNQWSLGRQGKGREGLPVRHLELFVTFCSKWLSAINASNSWKSSFAWWNVSQIVSKRPNFGQNLWNSTFEMRMISEHGALGALGALSNRRNFDLTWESQVLRPSFRCQQLWPQTSSQRASRWWTCIYGIYIHVSQQCGGFFEITRFSKILNFQVHKIQVLGCWEWAFGFLFHCFSDLWFSFYSRLRRITFPPPLLHTSTALSPNGCYGALPSHLEAINLLLGCFLEQKQRRICHINVSYSPVFQIIFCQI